MLLGELLEDLDLGQEVAENEDDLAEVFVETQAFELLLNDQVDLVTGLKGTGKSALYRMLTEYTGEYPSIRDTIIVRAVNPTGNPVFKVLFNEQASEERLRSIWAAYLASLIGNAIVDEYMLTPGVRVRVQEILEVLETIGLRQPEQRRKSLLQKIRAAQSIEPSVTASTAGSFVFGLKFSLGEDESAGAISLEQSDFLTLIKSCAEVLDAVHRRLWVAIDRLDECFLSDTPLERRALRALLRTQRDLANALRPTRSIDLKVFLRTDLMRRMTSDAPFTAASHFRQTELRWTVNSIETIVGKRLLTSDRFREAWPEVQPGPAPFRSALQRLIPARLEGRAAKPSPILICEWTSDGHRGFNPRNVLSLLRLALEKARDRERARAHPSVIGPSLVILSEADIISALGDLSRKRLRDSVINEFPRVETLVRRLERRSAIYETRSELVGVLDLADATIQEQDAAIGQLLLSGVLSQNQDAFMVPRLYRAALKAPLRRHERST